MVGIRDYWHSVGFCPDGLVFRFHTAGESILRTEGPTWNKMPSSSEEENGCSTKVIMFLFLLKISGMGFRRSTDSIGASLDVDFVPCILLILPNHITL